MYFFLEAGRCLTLILMSVVLACGADYQSYIMSKLQITSAQKVKYWFQVTASM